LSLIEKPGQELDLLLVVNSQPWVDRALLRAEDASDKLSTKFKFSGNMLSESIAKNSGPQRDLKDYQSPRHPGRERINTWKPIISFIS
jgi:hypothetical protein